MTVVAAFFWRSFSHPRLLPFGIVFSIALLLFSDLPLPMPVSTAASSSTLVTSTSASYLRRSLEILTELTIDKIRAAIAIQTATIDNTNAEMDMPVLFEAVQVDWSTAVEEIPAASLLLKTIIEDSSYRYTYWCTFLVFVDGLPSSPSTATAIVDFSSLPFPTLASRAQSKRTP